MVALLPSWELHLRAERKSPSTIKSYGDGVRRYLEFCTAAAAEPLARTTLNTFVVDLLESGAEPATARSRQLAVRRSTAWLTDEDEIPTDSFLGVKAPKWTSGSSSLGRRCLSLEVARRDRRPDRLDLGRVRCHLGLVGHVLARRFWCRCPATAGWLAAWEGVAMFMQVIQGRPAAEMSTGCAECVQDWRRDVQPGATGFLGSTMGVSPDGTGVLIAAVLGRRSGFGPTATVPSRAPGGGRRQGHVRRGTELHRL